MTDSLDIYSAGVLVGSIPCYFQKLVLFKDGTVKTGYSFSQILSPKANSASSGIINNRLQASVKYEHCWYLVPVDLTKFNSLKFNAYVNMSSANYSGSFYISNTGGYPINNISVTQLTTTPTIYTVDVSALEGIYYIGIHASCSDGEHEPTAYCSFIELS